MYEYKLFVAKLLIQNGDTKAAESGWRLEMAIKENDLSLKLVFLYFLQVSTDFLFSFLFYFTFYSILSIEWVMYKYNFIFTLLAYLLVISSPYLAGITYSNKWKRIVFNRCHANWKIKNLLERDLSVYFLFNCIFMGNFLFSQTPGCFMWLRGCHNKVTGTYFFFFHLLLRYEYVAFIWKYGWNINC